MTATALRDLLLAERFGPLVREAHAALASATNWSPTEQAVHRDELLAAVDGREAPWNGQR